MRILVTGNEGQVAQSLRERGAAAGRVIIGVGRPEFDLGGDPEAITQAIVAARPDAVVSAAAYTAVDRAEGDAARARAVNVAGAAAVAKGARLLGVPLLHLSTDYVFDGAKQTPYREDDPTCPVSVYGATKRDGELEVLATYSNVAILRTAWVYSPFGNNFAKTMLRLATERDVIGVVSDQDGNPTSAIDIADGLLAIATNLIRSQDPAHRGIFHMTGSGSSNWAEFAEAIFEASSVLGGPAAQVRRIKSQDYPTLARRPANSILDCSKLQAAHDVKLPGWKSSMQTVVRRLLFDDRQGVSKK